MIDEKGKIQKKSVGNDYNSYIASIMLHSVTKVVNEINKEKT